MRGSGLRNLRCLGPCRTGTWGCPTRMAHVGPDILVFVDWSTNDPPHPLICGRGAAGRPA
eukprot:6905949-Pyramimonas_sp.AAC.1